MELQRQADQPGGAQGSRAGPAHSGLVAERQPAFTKELFSPLPARYDRLEAILSMGQNSRWRREMVGRIMPGDPKLVLDIATGTAGVALQIEKRTGARVVGIDLTRAMLEEGRRRVSGAGRRGAISLVLGDADRLPFEDGTFDALCFTYLLRYVPDPGSTLREIARVVRPGGVIASLEFMRPPNDFWRAAWFLYTRLVLPLGGLATGGRAWFDVGRFLGPNISSHYERYPLDQTIVLWEKAGIDDVGYRLMSLGGGLVMWGRRNGE
jgi:demethylmenaquinone methyltransferase / 2-methoxy-6-polyprenyl-1,4-benzoquinol methylase